MSVEGEFHPPLGTKQGGPPRTQEPIEYVLGFMISEKNGVRRVLLIRKTKPEWQKGKLNGVGGKIEPLESSVAAMVREFREETGIDTVGNDWKQFATVEGPGYRLYVFSFFADRSELYSAQNLTDEPVFVIDIDSLYERFDLLPNVPWLVAMALSFKRGEKAYSFRIEETVV